MKPTISFEDITEECFNCKQKNIPITQGKYCVAKHFHCNKCDILDLPCLCGIYKCYATIKRCKNCNHNLCGNCEVRHENCKLPPYKDYIKRCRCHVCNEDFVINGKHVCKHCNQFIRCVCYIIFDESCRCNNKYHINCYRAKNKDLALKTVCNTCTPTISETPPIKYKKDRSRRSNRP